MANEAISNIALLYSMAALSGEGGSGGGSGGTVSVKVHATYTIESTEEARVENVGTEKDVQLDFYIPRGLEGKSSQWFISDGKPRSVVEGSTDGDLILYTTGDVYKVINGIPVDQHLSLSVGQILPNVPIEVPYEEHIRLLPFLFTEFVSTNLSISNKFLLFPPKMLFIILTS